MIGEPIDFNHVRDRRSLKHRYAEVEGEVRPMVVAALQNEAITRGRVVALEGIRDRSLWGRLRWLLRGK